MATFNPGYVPSGLRNARNPYEAKINNVRLSRRQDTRPSFSGDGPLPPEPSGFLTSDGNTLYDVNNNQFMPRSV